MQNINLAIQNNLALIHNVEAQIIHHSHILTKRTQGTLPSNINTKKHVKVISLRSGRIIEQTQKISFKQDKVDDHEKTSRRWRNWKSK
jgi:hypothetical protein